jgi:alkanesulfonate monooxygenase SsuD/methylene tetrahydromethanopterin reductase-like flavin-dependent oxidoreductase (luciferase family)
MRRIGLRVPKERGLTESLEFAGQAVDAGVDSLWVAEGLGRNRVIMMSLLADRFDDVGIGSGILNIYSRTPALLAMTAAGLDDLADRVMLGLGTSGRDVVEQLHGVEFGNPLRRERETIEIIDQLLAGETVEYDGEYFDLSGYGLRDIDEPLDVPIYLAAMGDTNLKLTGEFADGWIPLYLPVEYLEPKFELIQEGLTKRGRDASEIDVAPYVVTCISASDPAGARDAARSLLAFYIGAMGEFHYRNIKQHGFDSEADQIRTLWTDGERDAARAAVTDGMLASLTISGSPADAGEALERYYENGADLPIAYLPPKAERDLLEDTIDHLAEL